MKKLHRVALAVTLPLALFAAACSSSPGTASSATSTDVDQSALFATPDASEGVAAVSCGSDVVYGELPSDLQSDQLARYTELVIDGQTVMRSIV